MVDDVVHICIIGRASANVSILKPIQPIQLKISLDPGSLPTDNHMFILQYQNHVTENDAIIICDLDMH